jgi:methylthioribose-1-phosphate isomerase
MRVKIDEQELDLLAVQIKNHVVKMIDQRLLPFKFEVINLPTWRDTARAITNLVTRGAGSVGVAGAFAMAQAAHEISVDSVKVFLSRLKEAGHIIAQARPTAVTLSAAVEFCLQAASHGNSIHTIRSNVDQAAHHILMTDIWATETMGEKGAQLLKPESRILTHCNTGALAIQDSGSALGVIRFGFKSGKVAMVYVSETRPWLQGSRLTTWELRQEDIPHKLIIDSACGYLFNHNLIDAVIVGADRIAANGDVANKIGTYEKAVLAHVHNVPFYVVAPTFAFDTDCKNGKKIDIEKRPANEVRTIMGQLPSGEIGPVQIAPEHTDALNPIFDITPAKYITSFITEQGVLTKINVESIAELVNQSEYWA